MHDQHATLGQFLDAAAAKQPTPGGGSVTALVGALAASMGEMTVNYSVGKKGLEQHAPELAAALAQFHAARLMLLELMIEDQSAYAQLTSAKKMPPTGRAAAMTEAVDLCISVPQAMAATAITILDLSSRLIEKVNLYLLSDLAVCADLAMATLRCALCNVRVNLPEIADNQRRTEIESTSAKLLSRGTTLIQQVSPQIWRRIAAGGQN